MSDEKELSEQLTADLDTAEGGETQPSRFKNKHSLDSDEEDNCENYDVMDEDDIEGLYIFLTIHIYIVFIYLTIHIYIVFIYF